MAVTRRGLGLLTALLLPTIAVAAQAVRCMAAFGRAALSTAIVVTRPCREYRTAFAFASIELITAMADTTRRVRTVSLSAFHTAFMVKRPLAWLQARCADAFTVMYCVLPAGHQLKVFGSVIEPVPVDVMADLVIPQQPADLFLQHQPVFKHISESIRRRVVMLQDSAVALRGHVRATLPAWVTFSSARAHCASSGVVLPSAISNLRRGAIEGHTTVLANQLHFRGILPGHQSYLSGVTPAGVHSTAPASFFPYTCEFYHTASRKGM